MGTRNLTMLKLGDKLFGQYGQWDGYPKGAGCEVFNFIRKSSLEALKVNFKNSKFLTHEEVRDLWNSIPEPNNIKIMEGCVSMEKSMLMHQKHPQLSRDTGAKILAYIENTQTPELKNDIDFAGDSLFCEWGYLLDLDNEVFEIYRGFQKSPLPEGERFRDFSQSDPKYYPIKMLCKFSFNEIKGFKDSAEFLNALPKEEE